MNKNSYKWRSQTDRPINDATKPARPVRAQLKAGTYAFNVAGGAAAGAFTASIEFPRSFQWNHDAITLVNRSQPLTIRWTRGTAGALVSTLENATAALGPKGAIAAAFQCWADATQGSFTVPVPVLAALPARLTDHGRSQGTLAGMEALCGNTFAATGIDYGTIFFSDS